MSRTTLPIVRHRAFSHTEGVKLLRGILEFLLVAAMTAAAPLIVCIDSVVLRNGMSEYSITEISEDVLLLFSAGVFFIEARRQPESRGFLTLVGGFFLCMLIREMDFAFDAIRHGAWVFPALFTAAASLVYAGMHRDSVFAPMAAYVDTKSCIYISIGLLIVLVFSRLFGSGRLIWNAVMGANYRSDYKAIIQEGLELFGYVFITYGAALLPRERRMQAA
jgi:hypothetical protein